MELSSGHVSGGSAQELSRPEATHEVKILASSDYIKWTLKQQQCQRQAWLSYLAGKAEAIFWMALSALLFYFGNGHQSTFTIFCRHPGVNRQVLAMSGFLVVMNICIFMYVQLYLRAVKGNHSDPEFVAPWAIPCASVCGVGACILFCIACRGVWSWATPLIMVIHMMGAVMSLHFMPPVGKYKQL